MDDGEIVLMEHGQTSLVKQDGTVSKHGQGIVGMNEDVTADDRVEPAPRLPSMNVGLDALDMLYPLG